MGGRTGNAGTRRDAASIERTGRVGTDSSGRACEPAPLGLSLHAIDENAIEQALDLVDEPAGSCRGSVDYADRLDQDRLAANNPFRMLIDRAGFVPGKNLIFGSDGMPHGAACAFRWSISPPYPGQRLTVEELVAGYGEARGGAHGSGAREGVTVETGLEDAS